MKIHYTVRIHVSINGEYHRWESLSPEKRKEIGIALNDRALRAAGYKPVETLNKNDM